jgi:GMP synthase (glutamine-hydrolysing)
VLLPVKTVGVMGDGRTYDSVCACARDQHRRHDRRHLSLRRRLPQPRATRIINEVKGINRVVYDYTASRPARSSGNDFCPSGRIRKYAMMRHK